LPFSDIEQVFAKMTTPATVPKERQATLRSLFLPGTNEELDRAIVLWFPGPRSFTGEDMVEIHVHGSVAVVDALLDALSKLGFGMAAPGGFSANHCLTPLGEFSQRAFHNGKMDISSIEGLADLINAETQLQRRQALWQMAGGAEEQYKKWVQDLTKILATIEALIDFGDDEMIEMEVLALLANYL
jgi:tRNA U34 5-carboxymethylaminomethyl modifying GTPase MnmE/TrmE